MDIVAVGAIAALAGSIIVFVFIGIKVKNLINNTHSKSED
jgi:hypothetical protein